MHDVPTEDTILIANDIVSIVTRNANIATHVGDLAVGSNYLTIVRVQNTRHVIEREIDLHLFDLLRVLYTVVLV